MRALFAWFLSTQVFEPTGAEWIKALKASGVKLPAFTASVYPNSEIRRRAVARQNAGQ